MQQHECEMIQCMIVNCGVAASLDWRAVWATTFASSASAFTQRCNRPRLRCDREYAAYQIDRGHCRHRMTGVACCKLYRSTYAMLSRNPQLSLVNLGSRCQENAATKFQQQFGNYISICNELMH